MHGMQNCEREVGLRRLIRCGVFSATLIGLGVLTIADRALASFSNVYISQNGAGSADGSSCANAKAAAFFNTAANWGTGANQIGPGTTVHLCGVFTGGLAANLLQFQGSGTVTQPVTLLFETGAIVQAAYCAANGCIDTNGQSHLIIDGGTPCGKLNASVGPTTSCNGLIRNTLAGDSGQSCPAGPCTQQIGSTASDGIGAPGNGAAMTDIEVRNLTIGPMYVRTPHSGSPGGDGTVGVELSHQLPTNIRVHHMVIFSTHKHILIAWLDGITGVQDNFQFYNISFNDQCWALGMGTGNSPGAQITGIKFHDNEITNWDNWAPWGPGCHGNGTMLFNGNASVVFPPPFGIGDPTSWIYNNYVHGDLAGGAPTASPSGMLSCQDNCLDVQFFNNVIVSTCNQAGCGGDIYTQGAAGGRQKLYNNTIVCPTGAGSNPAEMNGQQGNITAYNNVVSGCLHTFIFEFTFGPNGYALSPGDNNNSDSSSDWICNHNGPGPPGCLTLLQWQAPPFSQDLHSTAARPNLDANFRPQPGSPAIGLGRNLTSLGIPPLNFDILGNPRPATGNWDAGGYAASGSSRPNPPTGLRATVQ